MINAESPRDCGEKSARSRIPNHGSPEASGGLIALDVRVATPERREELPSGPEEGWSLVDFGAFLLAVRVVIPRDKGPEPTDQQPIKSKSRDRPSKLKVDEQPSKAKAREDSRYLNREELCEFLGISRRYSYQLMAERAAPRPIRVGKRHKWKVDEVERWIDSRRAR